MVGDRIDRFAAGQLVLVGPNLPHHWISDLEPGGIIHNRDAVFQFHPDWIAGLTQYLPELTGLDPLLARATRGIEFTGETAERAKVELLAIEFSQPGERIQHILRLLELLNRAEADEYRLLSSPHVPVPNPGASADILAIVTDHVFSDADGDVRLADIARQVGMSPSTLSRLFTKATGQRFSDAVRKLRLAKARQLLETTDEPIAHVARASGYLNWSNFNRQFRR